MTVAGSSPPPHLARYRPQWGARTILDAAKAHLNDAPDHVAFVDAGTAHRLDAILADAQALATSLTKLGVKPGEVISFQTPNWHEAAAINLAATIGGFVVNPIVPIYRDAEVGHMLRDGRSRVLFLAEAFRGYDYAAMMDRLRPDLPDLLAVVAVRPSAPRGDDYAALVAAGRGRPLAESGSDPDAVKLLLYTSGTTGRPKAVLHSHNSLARVMEASARHWGIAPGEAMLMPSPVTHISGYANGLEMPLLLGTRTILMESWDARAAIDLIEAHDIRGTVAATPFLQELAARAAEAGTDLPSLRFFACGGAPVPPELIRQANARFGRTVAFRVYGSSEVPLVTLGFPDDGERAAATDGQIIDYEVRVVGDDGQPLPIGGEGELIARGPSMFVGYADPGDTADALDTEGFFRTGDIGIVSADGAVTITGRKKDLIIRGGENISAKEIEDMLGLHPAIVEASVVAMPHARLGEGICAVMIARGADQPTIADLATHLTEHGLARQKCPERIVWVGEFPRTPSGKIRKDQLRLMTRETAENAA
jgi:acyl-CoA synthetase (AMP-forming)/AMP-acid ligase II